MPFNISQSLVSELPEVERGTPESVGTSLGEHSGWKCWLCDGHLNPAAETLEADHEIPRNVGGTTTLQNLKLVHQECNRAKRNYSTERIRPYLKLKRFIRSSSRGVRYDGLTGHFGITLGESKISIIDGEELKFEFANGDSTTVPLFTDSSGTKEWKYTFVTVPRCAIWSDAQVQPRNIRYDHAFKIYLDLLQNPLYEPPGCRVDSFQDGALQRILMFDGQHKTVASWMAGKQEIVVKLYLNLDVNGANYLVNSIQSKINKLPLSAFELSAKMADEWRNKVDEYTEFAQRAGQVASEKGFIEWVPTSDRTRAKSAFKLAIVQQVLDASDFRITQYLEPNSNPGLTETMIKNKVIEKMIRAEPFELSFEDSQHLRDLESENIILMWNLVIDAFSTGDEPDPRAQDIEALRRLFKQESLTWVSGLLMAVFKHVLVSDSADACRQPTEEQWASIEKAIANITEHPVWRAEFERDSSMMAVKEALSKNQKGSDAFKGVHLNLSYAVVGAADVGYANHWML